MPKLLHSVVVFLVNEGRGRTPATKEIPAPEASAGALFAVAEGPQMAHDSARFGLFESPLQEVVGAHRPCRHGASGTDGGKADRFAVALGDWPVNDDQPADDRDSDADHDADE